MHPDQEAGTPVLDHKPETDEEFQSYLAEIRELAQGPFDEMQNEIEKTNVFPPEFFELSRKHNLYRFYLPEQYGGWGLSTKQIFQVQEEFSRGPGGMRMHLHHAAGLNWRIMDDFGQEELKTWAMPRFADKTLYINFALTEAEAGSGADIKTSAVRDGDDWVINGEKTLISHTDCSDGTYLITLTDPAADKDHRLTAFFVPVDTPGYEIVEMEHMMAAAVPVTPACGSPTAGCRTSTGSARSARATTSRCSRSGCPGPTSPTPTSAWPSGCWRSRSPGPRTGSPSARCWPPARRSST